MADLEFGFWWRKVLFSHQKLFESLNTKMAENLDGLEEKVHLKLDLLWFGTFEDGRIFGCKSCFVWLARKLLVWKLLVKVEIIETWSKYTVALAD